MSVHAKKMKVFEYLLNYLHFLWSPSDLNEVLIAISTINDNENPKYKYCEQFFLTFVTSKPFDTMFDT